MKKYANLKTFGKQIFSLILIGIILSTSPSSAQNHSPKRSFNLGFCPVPQQADHGQPTTDDWMKTFSLLAQNAEYVLHHVHLSKEDWKNFATGESVNSYSAYPGLEFIVLMAVRHNLEVFVVIDPLTSNREEISPNPFANGFHDPNIRNAFKNFSLRIARDCHRLTNGKILKYTALGSEVNTYFKSHPNDASNFITLYRETYRLLKSEFPQTRITSTLQYELLNGRFDGNPRWDIILQFGAQLDAVAITTYPSAFFENPDAIPNDYYLRLKQFTKKPIVVAESGWPTAGDPSWHGSKENQKRFLARFIELTSKMNLKLLIWWFLHDSTGEGYPAYFRSMGLRTSDGVAKPAWETWQKIFSRQNKNQTSL